MRITTSKSEVLILSQKMVDYLPGIAIKKQQREIDRWLEAMSAVKRKLSQKGKLSI